MDFKDRIYNFSAGPSLLPLEVIEKVAKDLPNYQKTGQSVMEMSHRSKEFGQIIEDAEANLRKLLAIPENYKVLFLQGGGTLQFAMVPLNLLRKSGRADYVVTGNWAKKAFQEACKFGDIVQAASSEDKNFTYIPNLRLEDFRKDADYIYICHNNTIYGTQYRELPNIGEIPLVSDMSSCLLSEEIDVSRYGLIWAGAQKNIGPAGTTIVIIRDDLLGCAKEDVPTYLNYKIHSDKNSLYNTPPCFTTYVAGEVFKHLLAGGGIKAVEEENVRKAEFLYSYIDNSKIFTCPVRKRDRSLMNVVFRTGDENLDAKFVAEARNRGLINLKGHRNVGGMRASIYNAMTFEGVKKLVEFMEEFETRL